MKAAVLDVDERTFGGGGCGQGPREEAFICTLQIATAHEEFFMHRLGYAVATTVPADLAVSPRRMRYMRMVGALASIHILLLRRAPQPLSPIALLYILRGPTAFNDDPKLLKSVSLDDVFC